MPYPYAVVYGGATLYRAPPTLSELRMYEHRPVWHDLSTSKPPGPPSDSESTRLVQHPFHPVGPENEPRLRDLRGERNSPMIRRMLTGMYVALDRTVRSRQTGGIYWHTQSGGYVRAGPLSIVRNVSTFAGVVLDATHTLPFAFMVSPAGWDYRLSPNLRTAAFHKKVPRLTAIQITADPPVTLGTQRYYRKADGFAVNATNVRVATLRPVPQDVGPTEKWIDVDLDQQILVAYEGARPVFVTLVSTGRRSESNPERNYETPAGSFRIRSKHVSTTMDGDTAADGPYSIEDVPWSMYFHERYALHAAFWHNKFGWRMSHGCVNLSPADAHWIFFWSNPQLPSGWHGIYAGEENSGTRVEIHHGDAPVPTTPPSQSALVPASISAR